MEQRELGTHCAASSLRRPAAIATVPGGARNRETAGIDPPLPVPAFPSGKDEASQIEQGDTIMRAELPDWRSRGSRRVVKIMRTWHGGSKSNSTKRAPRLASASTAHRVVQIREWRNVDARCDTTWWCDMHLRSRRSDGSAPLSLHDYWHTARVNIAVGDHAATTYSDHREASVIAGGVRISRMGAGDRGVRRRRPARRCAWCGRWR